MKKQFDRACPASMLPSRPIVCRLLNATTLTKDRTRCYNGSFDVQEVNLPLYEYRCEKCGVRIEKIQKFSDPPLTTCEKCGGELTRLLSAPAIQFKGSGWYVTDYARKSSSGESGKSESRSSSKPASSSESSSSKGTSPDSKAPISK